MEYGLVGLWLAVYLLLLLVGLPLAAVLCRPLADRGAGLAIPLSAALLWLAGYWIGHVSLLLALPAGIGLLCAQVVLVKDRWNPDLNWRIVGETAAVFTVAFGFLVAIRAVDPAVHPGGGEKFLDFGLVKSILRADALPPEDMWFAGEPVSYYYGGHLLTALLARITGTAPRFAYNLALSGFYAMLVTAAYGLAGSIAASRGSSRRLGGLFGAFFIGIASNLSTPLRFLGAALPDWVAAPVAGSLGVDDGVIGMTAAEFASWGPGEYWTASRIIDGTINEFPLFAWLNGDLHAHMMSTPFLLLTAGLLYSYYRTPERLLMRRRLLVFGCVPVLAGMIAVVNTWSFPTVGGLAVLALLFAPSDPGTLLPAGLQRHLPTTTRWYTGESRRLLLAGASGVAVLLLGLLWSSPFWAGPFLKGTGSSRTIETVATRSSLGGLLLVHGAFLLVFVPALLQQARQRIDTRVLIGSLLLLLSVLLTVSRPGPFVLFVPLVLVGWTLLRRVAPTTGGREHVTTSRADGAGRFGPGFETVLVIAGAGLALIVELVYLKEEAGPGRMNTVFKTYAQVWVLWSVAAGAVLSRIVTRQRPNGATLERWKAIGVSLGAALLIVSTSLYAGFALSQHFTTEGGITRTDDPTLDAKAFLDVRHPKEAPAIQWFDAREGRPTIVSKPGSYRWDSDDGYGASAVSSLTGIPTVLGWHHEIGYRGREAYDRRAAVVRTIYAGEPAERASLLAEYDVEYIYVGPAERIGYNPDLGDLDALSVLPESRTWPAVTVYEVNQSALDGD